MFVYVCVWPFLQNRLQLHFLNSLICVHLNATQHSYWMWWFRYQWRLISSCNHSSTYECETHLYTRKGNEKNKTEKNSDFVSFLLMLSKCAHFLLVFFFCCCCSYLFVRQRRTADIMLLIKHELGFGRQNILFTLAKMCPYWFCNMTSDGIGIEIINY